jgi:cellulose biosynthesis protein BcsQ
MITIMRRIAVHIQKGGVGKTTLSGNLGFAFVQAGKKVCLIDLDHGQGNLSTWLVDEEKISPQGQLVDYFTKEKGLEDILLEIRPRLFLLPTYGASKRFTSWIETELNRGINQHALRLMVSRLERMGFDFVIFDMPPSSGNLEEQVYLLVDEVISPITTDFFGIDGLEIFNEKIMDVERARVELEIPPLVKNIVVLNRINLSFSQDKSILASLKANSKLKLFTVRQSEALRKGMASSHLFAGEEEEFAGVAEDFSLLAANFLK